MRTRGLGVCMPDSDNDNFLDKTKYVVKDLYRQHREVFKNYNAYVRKNVVKIASLALALNSYLIVSSVYQKADATSALDGEPFTITRKSQIKPSGVGRLAAKPEYYISDEDGTRWRVESSNESFLGHREDEKVWSKLEEEKTYRIWGKAKRMVSPLPGPSEVKLPLMKHGLPLKDTTLVLEIDSVKEEPAIKLPQSNFQGKIKSERDNLFDIKLLQ